MNISKATVQGAIGGAFVILALAGSGAGAEVTDADTMPVSVIIGAPGTATVTPTVEPTVTPIATATATATPGKPSNGGGNSGGGSNVVTGLPTTGAAQQDGSDLVPALLVLAGGGMLAGSVYVGRRRTA